MESRSLLWREEEWVLSPEEEAMVDGCCFSLGWEWGWEAETERGGGGVRVFVVVGFVEGVEGKKDVRVVVATEGERPGLIRGLVEPVDGGPRYI